MPPQLSADELKEIIKHQRSCYGYALDIVTRELIARDQVDLARFIQYLKQNFGIGNYKVDYTIPNNTSIEDKIVGFLESNRGMKFSPREIMVAVGGLQPKDWKACKDRLIKLGVLKEQGSGTHYQYWID